MSTQLSPDIRSQLQKLAQKDAFVQSLDDFVHTAIKVLSGTGEDHTDQTCPTALLLAFSHCYCNNQPWSTLASELPEPIRQQFIQSCQKYSSQQMPILMQEGIEYLSDVQWNIDVYMGRQIWNIKLMFESGKVIKLVLNYEQLSVLVFKLGQVVAYIQNYQP